MWGYWEKKEKKNLLLRCIECTARQLEEFLFQEEPQSTKEHQKLSKTRKRCEANNPMLWRNCWSQNGTKKQKKKIEKLKRKKKKHRVVLLRESLLMPQSTTSCCFRFRTWKYGSRFLGRARNWTCILWQNLSISFPSHRVVQRFGASICPIQ